MRPRKNSGPASPGQTLQTDTPCMRIPPTLARAVLYAIPVALMLLALPLIARSGSSATPDTSSAVWRADQTCTLDHQHTAATGFAPLDFFSADGAYMPRTQCMVNAQGETDWAWVWALVALKAIIIAGYLRIFVFWRRAYLQEDPQDRNNKLMDLAWMFLLCAACGYVSSIVLFFWPGYRLLAFMLIPLAFITWKFASNLESFKLSLSAKRLSRQLHESLHQQNERLEEEVARKTEDLELAKQRADRANNAKSDFLARMSHEIRTPMSAILGYIDLALEDTTADAQREAHLRTVRRNTEHLLNIINDVLDFSKIESGAMTYESIPFSVRALVEDTRHLMIAKAREKDLQLRITIDDDAPDTIASDPTRVKQLLTNLIGNAIKFTDRGTISVDVSVLRAGPGHRDAVLEFRVRDTGIGMSDAQRSRIFTAFAQANSSTSRRFGGTGLGLSISRRIARDLGGDLTVDSVPGKGSTFVASLACRIHSGAPERPATDERTHLDRAVESLRNTNVLLVEDGDDNAKLILHKLNKIHCRTTRATDGLKALAELHAADARSEPFDLVLMDISMPNLDGIEATRTMRTEGIETPVVMLSAHALDTERERAMDAGADAYATKPIDFPELFKTCAAVLAHKSRRRAA